MIFCAFIANKGRKEGRKRRSTGIINLAANAALPLLIAVGVGETHENKLPNGQYHTERETNRAATEREPEI